MGLRFGEELGRKLEAPYNGNQLHGLKRSWHPDGARRAEFRYDHGMLTEAHAWSAAGRPLSPAEARALAVRDASTDERYYQTLEQIVRDNLPSCE